MGSYPHPIPTCLPGTLLVLVGELYHGLLFFHLLPQHLKGFGKSRKHELLKGRAAHLDGVVELFGDGPRLHPKRRVIPGKRGSLPHDLPYHTSAVLLHREPLLRLVKVLGHTDAPAANHKGTVVHNPSGLALVMHLLRTQKLGVPSLIGAQSRLCARFAR